MGLRTVGMGLSTNHAKGIRMCKMSTVTVDSDVLVVTRDVSVCAPRVIACGAVVARPRLLLVAVLR